MHTYKDRFGCVWTVELVPAADRPMHEGMTMPGWRVTVDHDGAATTHQHTNLAEAIAQAVLKHDHFNPQR
jgi:hypothetical protein